MNRYLFIFCCLLFFSHFAYAFGGNSYSPLIYARQLEQMQQEAQEAEDRFNQLKDEVTHTQQMVSDAEGHYGFGNMGNSIDDLKNRQWSPDSWDDALKGLAGGNSARYQQLLDEYSQNNPTLSQNDYKKGASDDKAKVYQQQVDVNRAAQVQASYAFNDINQHLQNVHDLSAQIEQAKNSKAAIDLNSRLVAELAYIEIQELKLQTLINQQQAEQESESIAGETQNAKFNTLSDE